MQKIEIINKINNNKSGNYLIEETDIWLMDQKLNGLVFSLKNENKDNIIKNPYEVALDLIRNGDSVLEVTLIEWDKYSAFTYYLDKNGIIGLDEEEFDKFAKFNENNLGKQIRDIYFKVLPLKHNNLIDLVSLTTFEQVVKYFKELVFRNKLRDKRLDWEMLEFFQNED